MKSNIKEITARLETGVKEVFESDRYKEYLAFTSKFYRYSANNCILIMMQNPQASFIAGYKAWQNKFKRQVKQGEKAIKIIVPCPHRYTREIEDNNGDITEQEVAWTSFRVASVFDISQTEGEDVPQEYITELEGRVNDYDELMSKLANISPVPISYEPMNRANGYYSLTEKKIALKECMSEQQTVKTLIHEISHAMLHDKDDGTEKEADQRTREVQAESVAYTVCSYIGLDTSDYSFGYIAGWSKDKEVKELIGSMEVIRKTAQSIIEAVA